MPRTDPRPWRRDSRLVPPSRRVRACFAAAALWLAAATGSLAAGPGKQAFEKDTGVLGQVAARLRLGAPVPTAPNVGDAIPEGAVGPSSSPGATPGHPGTTVAPAQPSSPPHPLTSSSPHPPSPAPRLVIVLLDRVTIGDLLAAHAPTIQHLMRWHSVGLMNTASAILRNPVAAAATISAGAHAIALDTAGECLGGREPFEGGRAADAFFRRTLRHVSPSAILNLDVAPTEALNQARGTLASPGLLGDLLSRLGPTAVVGCSDGSPELPLGLDRLGPVILMRSSGIVDGGDDSPDLLAPAPAAPFGLATDASRLCAAYRSAARHAATVLVDLGETARAERYRPFLSQAAALATRSQAIARADALLARLLRDEIDLRRTRLVLLCPFPPLSDQKRIENLAPIVLAYRPPGYLTSGTTQTPGFVANLDLLPTLAADLRLPLPAAASAFLGGSRMSTVPGPGGAQALAQWDAEVLVDRRVAFGPVPPIIGVWTALAALGALAVALWRTCRSRWPLRAARFGVAGAATSPVALTLMPAFHLTSEPLFDAVFALLWMALAVLIVPFGRRGVIVALVATVAMFVSDTLLHTGLASRGILSNFALAGIRFHGLGNENMGLLIGTALMGLCLLGPVQRLDRAPTPSLALAGLAAVALSIVLGANGWGDNAGGLMAAVFGFGAGLWLFAGGRMGGYALLALLGAALSLLAGVATVDALGNQPSHIGHAALLFVTDGRAAVSDILLRKLGMDLRLATDPHALWFYAGAVGVCVLWRRLMAERGATLLAQRPGLRKGLLAGLVGAAAAFLFNDNGIVPAALILACLATALATAVLDAMVLDRDAPSV